MTREFPPSNRALAALHALFLAVFLAAGILLVREGTHAIRGRAYTLEYTEELSWAADADRGGSGGEPYAAEYRGREAVVFGIGFAALGALLLSWAAGLALGLLGRAGLRAPRYVPRLLGGLSLAAMAAAGIALFPPWQIRALPFHLVVAALVLAVALPIPARWRKAAFPAATGLVIASGLIGFPAFPIFAGLLAFLMAGANALVLWPGLVPRLERNHRKGQARSSAP